MPLVDPVTRETAAPRRWLSIVGIGEDGVDGLSAVARGLICGAEIVFGGKRHLALAATLIRGAVHPWPSPLDQAITDVVAHRGHDVCVLASGDPFFHGVGSVLTRHVHPTETLVVPAPSAFSLAAARLGWPLQETALVSAHGRSLDFVRPHLHHAAHVLVLTSDADGPKALATLLQETGFGLSTLHLLEALGGPRERMRTTTARDFHLSDINPLNIVGLDIAGEQGARVIARAPGLPDALFEHDGQITKREIRAITLSSLSPRRGDLLWDIGAGAGSVAIEWMLADPSMRAITIEARPDRAARIRRNAAAFGVPNLQVIEGAAPDALQRLAAPDAIFVGGGVSDPGVLDAAVSATRTGGRLVVNAVTLESESLLIARHASLGGELTRIALSRAAAVGEKTGWRPAMPITQWAWTKPCWTKP